jgi:methionyl-tRNA formyltransferase
MRLDVGLDTGDILLEKRVPIGPDTTASDIFSQLSLVGAELMIQTLKGLGQGTLVGKPQNHAEATLAPILNREEGRLNLAERTAQEVYNRWRGFYPWPGAHATLRGKRFLVHQMHLSSADKKLLPGDLDGSTGELLVGAAGGTLLALDEVQLEGKPKLKGMNFVRDFQLQSGERLD